MKKFSRKISHSSEKASKVLKQLSSSTHVYAPFVDFGSIAHNKIVALAKKRNIQGFNFKKNINSGMDYYVNKKQTNNEQ